jgi:hypothetical protein
VASLKNYSLDVLWKLVIPTFVRRFNFYTEVEDRLYFEEYEDPDQEFHLKSLSHEYKSLMRAMASKKLLIIN